MDKMEYINLIFWGKNIIKMVGYTLDLDLGYPKSIAWVKAQ
jgi:hypothetical protein